MSERRRRRRKRYLFPSSFLGRSFLFSHLKSNQTKPPRQAPLAAPKQHRPAAKTAAATSDPSSSASSASSAEEERRLEAENAALRSEVERALSSASSAIVEAFEARDAALRAELRRVEEAERGAAAAAAAAATAEEGKEEEKQHSPPPPPPPAVAVLAVAEGVAASVSSDGTILFSFDDAAVTGKARGKARASAAPVAPVAASAAASRLSSSSRGGRGSSVVVRALPPSSSSPSSPSSSGAGGAGAKKQGAAGKKGGGGGEKASPSSPSSSSSSPSPPRSAAAAEGRGAGASSSSSPSPAKAAAATTTTVVSTPPPTPKRAPPPPPPTPPPPAPPSPLDLALAAAEKALSAGDDDAFDAAVDNVLAEISSKGGEESEKKAASALAALAAATGAAAKAAAASPPPSGRGDWVYFTSPRRPVAGGRVAVFYNLANGSEGAGALRGSMGGRGVSLRLHARCNGWALPLSNSSSAGASDHFPLPPAPAPASDGSGSWHVAALDLPLEAFELDFVVEAVRKEGGGGGNDGNDDSQIVVAAVDNALGSDFVVPLASTMTPSAWGELALERAAAEAEARREAEREAEREAARERELNARREDAARGRARAEAAVTAAREARGLGVDSAMPLWTTSPKPLVAGGGGVLYFNAAESAAFKSSGKTPLKRAPVLHLGSNRWELPRDVEFVKCEGPPEVVKASSSSSAAASAAAASSVANGDWWRATLAPRAADGALSFVVRASFGENGGEETITDNNGGGDFFVSVQPPPAFLKPDKTTIDEEAWAASLAPEMELAERRQRETAAARAAASAAARAQARADAAAKAAAVRRRQQRHVLYTEPEPLKAGSKAILKYNPRDTPLNGTEKVFARVGFNRWSHPRGFEKPIEMKKPDADSGHFSLEVDVPRSAYSLQAVFSDAGEGEPHARYDNRGGSDYQLPVEGSPLAEPGLHVVHVAVEMAPIAKVGGLGDVVTALGRAVQESGHLVEVIVPRFGFFSHSPLLGAMHLDCEFDYGGTHVWVRVIFSLSLSLSFLSFLPVSFSPFRHRDRLPLLSLTPKTLQLFEKQTQTKKKPP